MKTLELSSFLSIIMSIVSSCNIISSHEPDMIFYKLDLNFQDVSGYDLVSGIGLLDPGTVKRDLYVLDIIASQSCEDTMDSWRKRPGFIPDENTSILGINKFNGFSFLTSEFILFANDCPNEKILTYKFKCPYVFGDKAEHEFNTYWDVPKIRNRVAYAKCNRIEFEGKFFTPIVPQEGYNSKVIIILEGRKNE